MTKIESLRYPTLTRRSGGPSGGSTTTATPMWSGRSWSTPRQSGVKSNIEKAPKTLVENEEVYNLARAQRRLAWILVAMQ